MNFHVKLFFFFFNVNNIIRSSAEFTSADTLLEKRVVMSTNVYIYTYIYITQNIYVRYINNLFLNTHAKCVYLWWVVFKLYILVHVS